MIVTLKSIVEKDTSESFLSYIKDQMIHLYSQLTSCEDVSLDKFIEFVKYNNVYVYIDTKFIIKGTISVLYEKKLLHGGKDVAHIEDFVVNEKYRGLNVGKELMDFVIDETKQYNIYKIILNCSKSMEAFYKKFNFTHKNIEMSYYI
jgi:ribosomal protein S18 acetylase RimI-like enzyme